MEDRRKEERRKEERRKGERRKEDRNCSHELDKLKSNNAELQLIYNYLHKLKKEKFDK